MAVSIHSSTGCYIGFLKCCATIVFMVVTICSASASTFLFLVKNVVLYFFMVIKGATYSILTFATTKLCMNKSKLMVICI